MNKDLIKYGLLALGAYLIWKYIEDNGGLSAVLGGASLTSPTVGQSATGAQLIAAGVAGFTGLTPGQVTQMSTETYTWDGSKWAQTTALSTPKLPANPTGLINGQCPTGTVWEASINSCLPNPVIPNPPPKQPASPPVGCPTGQTMINGVCTAPLPSSAVSARMLAAAGGVNSQNMDQWCYYWTQISGSPCPVDPGAIDPGVYAGAFGTPGQGDRTTPMDIGTWIAIINNQVPSEGLTGLGLVPYRYTPAWLM